MTCWTTATQASAAAAIQVDGYLRPGEVCNLRTTDVIRPRALAGKGYGRWGVLLGNSAEGETTKTGQVDDTVIIGDKVRQWTASLLRSITLGAEAKRSEPPFSYFDLASVRHGISAFGCTFEAERHSHAALPEALWAKRRLLIPLALTAAD